MQRDRAHLVFKHSIGASINPWIISAISLGELEKLKGFCKRKPTFNYRLAIFYNACLTFSTTAVLPEKWIMRIGLPRSIFPSSLTTSKIFSPN